MSEKIYKELKQVTEGIYVYSDQIMAIARYIETHYKKMEPKRAPLPDGTLELTEEEISTVEDMTGICFIDKIVYTIGKLRAVSKVNSQTIISNVNNVKATLYIAERFDLSGNYVV